MTFDNNILITKDGYEYKFNPLACASCGGACCTGESGYIWAKYHEIEKMAQFLELTIEEFATMYLRKVKHRYSIIERKIDTDNYACIFFDNDKKQCSIYPVRPTQCRSFPFWEIFKSDIEEVKKECPGILE
ncbi:MAG: YkgJ family cysteine cluster protein [Epsilonproteobacteria bacterium]|nr:YkgJ family cysteine cluster protein [Campylobacterota bacterium]